MEKQFVFQGTQPKITITLNENGSVQAFWQGVNATVFYGMLEEAKVAFGDHVRMEAVKAAMKGN